MNLDEFVRMLATEPATPNQIGAVRVEFRRLGLDSNRPARLAAAAALLAWTASARARTDLWAGLPVKVRKLTLAAMTMALSHWVKEHPFMTRPQRLPGHVGSPWASR